MPVINAQVVGDDYRTSQAKILDVWNARGGWFSVSGASVFVQLQYGPHAQQHFTDEIEVGNGAFAFIPTNCTGLQFRNSVAGQQAVVTAQIAQGDEPALAVSSLGTISVTGLSLTFQHNDVTFASEPILDFEDSATVTWTAADDIPNTRAQVTAAIPSSVTLPGAPKTTTPATADNSTKIATTAYVQAQGYVTALTAPVTSVFGRTGAVVATSGDYTAAQVTNAADKASASVQSFTGAITSADEITADDFSATGLTGTLAGRFVGGTAGGPPVSGTFSLRDFIVTDGGAVYVCTTAGSPGSWTAAGSVNNQVTSVFGRTGAVVATSGDYTAAQVTNAADKASASAQVFTGSVVSGANVIVPTSSTGVTLGAGGTIVATVAGATTNFLALGVGNGTDTVSRFVTRPDRLEWGPGTGSRDTFFARTTKGTSSGLSASATTGGYLEASGGIYFGGGTSSVLTGGTLTPDVAQNGVFAVNVTTGGGTLTIAAATNTPPAGESARIVIKIRVTGASAETLSWNAAYVFGSITKPASVAAGASVAVEFFWDPDVGSWRAIGSS